MTASPPPTLYHRWMGWHAPALRRVAILACIGLAVTLALLPILPWQPAVVTGWDAAALTYLSSIWPIILRADSAQAEQFATREDETRSSATVLLAASVASLLGVGGALSLAGRENGPGRILLIGLAVVTVLLSWTVVNTVYTLHYAHRDFGSTAPGITFGDAAGQERPTSRDFAYVAFTIGMTYQVSDTTVRDPRIRRAVRPEAPQGQAVSTLVAGQPRDDLVGQLGSVHADLGHAGPRPDHSGWRGVSPNRGDRGRLGRRRRGRWMIKAHPTQNRMAGKVTNQREPWLAGAPPSRHRDRRPATGDRRRPTPDGSETSPPERGRVAGHRRGDPNAAVAAGDLGGCPMEINRNAPATAAGELRIHADPQTVFAVISAIDQWPSWNADVKSVELQGPVQPGTGFRWKSGPSTLTSTLQVVDPPHEIAWTGTTMGIKAVHVFRFQASDGGTLAHSEESWEGLIAKLLNGYSHKTLDKGIRSILGHLKTEAERRAATA